MTAKALQRFMLLSFVVLVSYGLPGCSAFGQIPRNTPVATTAIGSTTEIPPTSIPAVIPDVNALQRWSQEDAQVNIETRFGIGSP